jgi:predicted DNA-binding ribbon-helix-helix protein
VGASRLINRNITAGAGRTSMRLEPEMWDALREICLREGLELRALMRRLEDQSYDGGRTSAVRVHVLEYFRRAATEEGHRRSGHGFGMPHDNMHDNIAAASHVHGTAD